MTPNYFFINVVRLILHNSKFPTLKVFCGMPPSTWLFIMYRSGRSLFLKSSSGKDSNLFYLNGILFLIQGYRQKNQGWLSQSGSLLSWSADQNQFWELSDIIYIEVSIQGIARTCSVQIDRHNFWRDAVLLI